MGKEKSKSLKQTEPSYVLITVLATAAVFANTLLPDNADGRLILVLYLILFFLLGLAGFVSGKKTKRVGSGIKTGVIVALISFAIPNMILLIINGQFRAAIGTKLTGLPVAALVGGLLGGARG